MKRMTLALITVASLALLADSMASGKKAADDQNTCGATVTLMNVTQDSDGMHWHFLFDIVESNASATATSTGSFNYGYVYFDAQQMPHSVDGIQGPGWHPGDGHEYRPVDTRSIPDAVSIDPKSVNIHDIVSTDCYAVQQRK